MQGTFQRIRQSPATTSSLKASRTTIPTLAPRSRTLPTLIYPYAVVNVPGSRTVSSGSPSKSHRTPWTATDSTVSSSAPPQGSDWEEFDRLGNHGARQGTASTAESSGSTQFHREVNASLERGESELRPDDLTTWGRLFTLMKDSHGHNGTWACFELLRARSHIHIILGADGSHLRDNIIASAAAEDTRLETVQQVALRLRAFSQEWPELYAKVVHSFLSQGHYEKALKWHLRLSESFPPGPEVLAGLLSSFIVDPKPEMQSTLTSLYVFSKERNLYDHIIPLLYNAGQSQLARSWRKKLVRFEDYPSSTRSRPFLDFVSKYYPQIELTRQELVLFGKPGSAARNNDSKAAPQLKHTPMSGIYSDEIVAKWFASDWLSVEFAINFVHRVGLQMIGARSLQALALREPDAESVAARIAQLEKLEIRIAPQTYCKALVFFARNGEDKLLRRLLVIDVHPNEFDDTDTRHMILEEAAKDKDWKREELFQGVEWAVENDTTPNRLNQLLRNILVTRNLGKAKLVVDRMEALNITMSENNAATLLSRVFWGVGKHPTRWKRKIPRGKPDQQLDRAINVVRRVASHHIGIPLNYWEHLIYSLGRLGRFEELLQLSLEVTQFFKPAYGGLVPVYRNDLPQVDLPQINEPSKEQPPIDPVEAMMLQRRRAMPGEDPKKPDPKPREEQRKSKSGEVADTHYIPADLPFTHRQHPVQKLFDTALQRSIVRWGFDQTLAAAATSGAATSSMRLADYDIASGVRILATLRDHGVLIDRQIIRSSIPTRIALAQVPKRRHPSRDSHGVSPSNVKRLVDKAWGSEVLPDLSELEKEVEKQRVEVWKRYPILFSRTYDRESDEEFSV